MFPISKKNGEKVGLLSKEKKQIKKRDYALKLAGYKTERPTHVDSVVVLIDGWLNTKGIVYKLFQLTQSLKKKLFLLNGQNCFLH